MMEEVFDILSTTQSHWGIGQTGIGLFEDGTAKISDNRKFKDEDGEWGYPTHRNIGGYPTIYTFTHYRDAPSIWLYPNTESNLHKLKKALKSLIGKCGITGETPIKSNGSRKILFLLNEVV